MGRKGFRAAIAGGLVLLGLLALTLHVALAHADSSTASIAIFNDTNATVPTGQATQYTINFECSAVEAGSCGTTAEITVPITLTSSNTAGTADPSNWTYTASSSTGLVQGQAGSTPVTVNYAAGTVTIPLNAASITPGQSLTIQLFVTQPNNTTPDGTTWSMDPAFETDAITSVTAPTPATGSASADPDLEVTKTTSNGATVYISGSTVTYTITAGCQSSGHNGNLYLTGGSLVDTLPSGMTYLSSNPTATSTAGQTVTWNYPDDTSVPSGCSAAGTGSKTYTVTAQLPSGSAQTFTNDVQLNGTPIGEAAKSTTASKQITTVTSSPDPGTLGGFVSKGALAPLALGGGGGDLGTYAGQWIDSPNQTPSYSAGAAEASYHVAISYPDSGAYDTEVDDPMPCLSNASTAGGITTYSSGQPASTPAPLCQSPAFHPTVFEVSAASLGAAIAGGWTPTVLLEDGSTATLTVVNSGASSVYYEIESADASQVAEIDLPANTDLSDPHTDLYMWGYMNPATDPGLPASQSEPASIVQNTAYATATQLELAVGQTVPLTATQHASASLFVEPQLPQLGVSKSFGSYTPPPSGTVGTAPVRISSTLALPDTLTGGENVVLTDLLPPSLSWSNPVASANFNVTPSGGSAVPVSATITHTADYNGTGQELVQIVLPSSAFSAPGYYQISPQNNNLLILNVPTGLNSYANDAQEFVQTIGDNVLPACASGLSVESSDPNDLDGDGQVAEDYCQATATLNVPGVTGPDISLVKQVQGANDSAFLDPTSTSLVGTNGVGSTTADGPATFKLTWQNFGSTNLTEPVIYDILPFVGDTGVSEQQSGTARGSQFATPFTGGISVTTAAAFSSSTVPSNASVEILYSQSLNPCRNEVYKTSDDPSCVNDWTVTPPSDLSTVKALEFVDTSSSDLWEPGDTITVTFNVSVPTADANLIAWNSAATTAEAGGTDLLPAEPPKVGIEAPLAVTPSLFTTVSNAAVAPGTPFSDSVTVTNLANGTGSDAWRLVGPVTPVDGSCAALDWSSAGTVASGTVAIGADGTGTTATASPTAPGCYSYVDNLTGSDWNNVNMSPGVTGETVLVATPSLTTAISSTTADTGDSITDAITVSNAGGRAGRIDWQLIGPVAPGSDGTCATADWSSGKPAASGTIVVFGDGVYTTPATKLTQAGCYGYEATLSGATFGGPSTSPAGSANEVVNVIDQSPPAVQISDTTTTATTPTPTPTTSTPTPPATTPTPTTPTTTVTTPAKTSKPTKTPAKKATPNLTISQHASAQSVMAGQSVTYTITVKNTGNGAAKDVKVNDSPQTTMNLVSVKGAHGACGKGFPLTCSTGTLAPGATMKITVVATPTQAGSAVNSANVSSKSTGGSTPTAAARVNSKVAVPLTLAQFASTQKVHAGANVRFGIKVTNATGVAAPSSVVCEQLPRGLALASASGSHHLRNGEICWTLKNVPAHSSMTLTLTARALSGVSGKLEGRATLNGRDMPTRKAAANVAVLPAPPKVTPVTG